MELDREEWDLSNADQLSGRHIEKKSEKAPREKQTSGGRLEGGLQANDKAESTVSMKWMLGVLELSDMMGFNCRIAVRGRIAY